MMVAAANFSLVASGGSWSLNTSYASGVSQSNCLSKLPFGEEVGANVGGRTEAQGYGQFDGNRKKWAQLERDDETGLDYAQARYYSNLQGRFTSPDEFNGGPVEVFTAAASANPTFYADLTNPQSLNKYQYTYNNPLLYVDPNGHCPDCGVIDRVVTSINEVLGSLFGSLQRAAGDGNAPEEQRAPGPLGNKDQVIQNYMDENAKAMERATDVVMVADVTGAGTTIRGALRGSKTEMAMGVTTMVTRFKLSSVIGKDVALTNLAKQAGGSVQKGIDGLTSQLAKGNLNPGLGTKNLFGNVSYARARDGARVFFRRVGDKIEILAKASKKNEAKVIKRLEELYNK